MLTDARNLMMITRVIDVPLIVYNNITKTNETVIGKQQMVQVKPEFEIFVKYCDAQHFYMQMRTVIQSDDPTFTMLPSQSPVQLISLARAMQEMKIPMSMKAHDAIEDCHSTLKVINGVLAVGNVRNVNCRK
jgi:hypothetical protein